MSTTTEHPATTPATGPTAVVDVARLEALLLGRYGDVRREARAFAGDPRFARIEGLTVEERRRG